MRYGKKERHSKSRTGIMQRIAGGPAHWLFRKQVVCDIWDTLMD